MIWFWFAIGWVIASIAVLAFMRGAHIPAAAVPLTPRTPLTFTEWRERLPKIPPDELREALEGLVRAGLLVETVRFEADGSKTLAWAITRTGLELDIYA